MTIEAVVIEDEIRSYKDKSGVQQERRTLHIVDKDKGPRLTTMVKFSIPTDTQPACLRDQQVTLSVSRIMIFDWDKSLGFDGQLHQKPKP